VLEDLLIGYGKRGEIKTPSVTERASESKRQGKKKAKGVHPLNNPEHWTERQRKKIKQSFVVPLLSYLA